MRTQWSKIVLVRGDFLGADGVVTVGGGGGVKYDFKILKKSKDINILLAKIKICLFRFNQDIPFPFHSTTQLVRRQPDRPHHANEIIRIASVCFVELLSFFVNVFDGLTHMPKGGQ